MIRTIYVLTLVSLASTACSETTRVEDDLADAQANSENPTGRGERAEINPAERPVRIGLGGPRFDACQGVGRIQGLQGRELDVRISPFDAAEKKDSIKQGQQVWICARSHDQQWHGIVYDDGAGEAGSEESDATGSDGPGDCGVSSPVRSKRDYDGPCKSGWVESNYVKLVAG